MSKAKTTTKEESYTGGIVGGEEKEPTMKETLESLQTQYKDFNEKAEYFKNMALKASGAIEVLTQIIQNEEKK